MAALNHPNICTLYDVGPDYLVMEYIEGPTLAERISRGPIPLEEALGIARQIIHRDQKPANLKIRPGGLAVYFRSEDRRIIVVNYSVQGNTFKTDKPRRWSNQLLAEFGNNWAFDLSPDGKRFAVLTPIEDLTRRETGNRAMLLVNYFDEVRRKMGGGR